MPHRHTVYCQQSCAAVTPEELLEHLETLDFLTLGEDYGLSAAAVKAARPLRIKDVRPGQFRLYHLSYGKAGRRPIEIDRWETVDQHRGAVAETIDNLAAEGGARAKTITALLRTSVDSVSVAFGTDAPAAMFAWEVVRYFASGFDGIVQADDGDWLTLGSDYQPRPV
jgi:hypothetical protein